MDIHQIPLHLRNTVEHLDLPIFIELDEDEGLCRPPANPALGDTLMVLGLLRNQGRPVKACFDPGPARELVEAHPLVRELAPPPEEPGRLAPRRVPVARSGRADTWVAGVGQRARFPVAPVDRLKANPILAHSMYYKLARLDDRPSVYVDPERPHLLADALPRGRELLVVYPLNPGRGGHQWQDPAWWAQVLRRLRPRYALLAVGARDYGELVDEVDAVLSQDDPASTLPDLAWLLSKAAGFLGRDGGLYHLAAAVNPRCTVVWDSMASYRFWAGSGGHHLVFSNPYTYRYPQTARAGMEELAQKLRGVELPAPQGQGVLKLSPRAGVQEAKELFGSAEAFRSIAQAHLEALEDRRGVRGWMKHPELKKSFYRQSRDFAVLAAQGQAPPGSNWVAPVIA